MSPAKKKENKLVPTEKFYLFYCDKKVFMLDVKFIKYIQINYYRCYNFHHRSMIPIWL